MNINSLQDIYRHMEWADAKVWAAVLCCEQALQDTKIREVLNHLHVAQRHYLRIWRGEPVEAPYPKFESTPELCEWAQTYYDEVNAFLASLTDAQIDAPIGEVWNQRMEKLLGKPCAPTTLGDTILQVPLHNQHHRGQLAARLRELGGTPPLIDYIAWVMFGRPGAEWPMGTE